MRRLERAHRSRRTDPGYGYLHVTADSAEGSGFRLVSDWPIGDNMIITRSPLRISVGGGGTDLPSYYREYSGFVIAAAIDKYVYINLHKEPVGKQDQYIAAYGGITCFCFLPNHQVEAWPLKIDTDTLYNLEDNLLMFYTGYSRSASTVLHEQDVKSKQHDKEMIANLHFIKELGRETKAALEAGDLERFAELMNIHWEYKKQRSADMSNNHIDQLYQLARGNGAL